MFITEQLPLTGRRVRCEKQEGDSVAAKHTAGTDTGQKPRDGGGQGARRGPSDDPGAVGRRVHRLRAERGLTQRQLAEPAYTAAYISTLEAAGSAPRRLPYVISRSVWG